MKSFILEEINRAAAMMRAMLDDPTFLKTTEVVSREWVAAFRRGNKILFAGNGGSAADSQHLAGELVCRLAHDRPGLPAISLTTDSSVVTAAANDYGYETIFERQINALGSKGDIFVAISTSGCSVNVLKAIEAANAKELVTVGFTGKSGGDMPSLCKFTIRVPADSTQKIQEGHIIVGHIICALVERELFGA